ncbi:MAG: rod shape-determining protein [Puniceicoccales bacterium]|jgi:rod shape-determining protein MreB|nr:rod shape-determining protein [Puniceicoccales bacterium]
MKRLPTFFSNAIGIDLGTANTLVYVKDRGIVMREPSVVAIHNDTRKPIAVGNEAKAMLGRTPGSITAIRPMKDGVIADFEISEHMLRYFINKAARKSFFTHLTVKIAVPYGITGVEKRAVLDSAYRAGANEAETIPEPIASALGVGLPVGEPAASMIVDIGGGTTEVAILSIGGIVYARSIRVGGDEFDASITNYVKRAYNLIIGERTAEEIKIQIGSAVPLVQELTLEVKGRDAMSGLPRPLYISSQEVREALVENLNAIIDAVKTSLERCPPELAADLVDRGIALAGGSSLLRGIDKLISDATGIPVFVGDDPLCAVVNGTGIYIEDERWHSH